VSDPTEFPAADETQGWERIWADQAAPSEYWRIPDPAVIEWARRVLGARRVLDLGCGLGRHTVALAHLGLNVVGGEVSPSGLDACATELRARGLPVLLVRHDMARLPFADATFDALLAFNVIYHATKDGLRAVLAEIRRVLNPGGHLFVTFLGRLERNISRYRADVARGACLEPEPFTFVYLEDPFEDKYLPHHYCDEAELGDLLAEFEPEGLVPFHSEFTDERGVHHESLHYHVQARRPEEV
jgi:tellurite methyltransferase